MKRYALGQEDLEPCPRITRPFVSVGRKARRQPPSLPRGRQHGPWTRRHLGGQRDVAADGDVDFRLLDVADAGRCGRSLPSRSRTRGKRPAGVVLTAMSCVVPSIAVAQPPSDTARSTVAPNGAPNLKVTGIPYREMSRGRPSHARAPELNRRLAQHAKPATTPRRRAAERECRPGHPRRSCARSRPSSSQARASRAPST